MLLVIDNYDSFTYNLVQYFGELGVTMQIARNDEITIEQIKDLAPTHICISPGPCTPNEAGISLDVIEQLAQDVAILGVCLGHQSIGQVFGAQVVRAKSLMHGKVSAIYHNEQSVFAGIASPFNATRYHSLVIDSESLPDVLEVTAQTEDGVIMGVQHKEMCVHGVQFHPESILTEHGKQILRNFLSFSAKKV